GSLPGYLGAVLVGVVKQDHIAGSEVARRASCDPLRRGEPAPVLAPAGPQQRLHAQFACRAQPGLAVDPERGAVEAALADHLDRSVQVGFNCIPGETEVHAVAVAMDRHLVAAPFDLCDEFREALALFADEEEDGLRAR